VAVEKGPGGDGDGHFQEAKEFVRLDLDVNSQILEFQPVMLIWKASHKSIHQLQILFHVGAETTGIFTSRIILTPFEFGSRGHDCSRITDQVDYFQFFG
jgi:hypothetical protein